MMIPNIKDNRLAKDFPSFFNIVMPFDINISGTNNSIIPTIINENTKPLGISFAIIDAIIPKVKNKPKAKNTLLNKRWGYKALKIKKH